MMRSRPPVERRLESRLEKLLAKGLAAAPSAPSCVSSGCDRHERRPGLLGGLAEAREEGFRALGEGRQVGEGLVDRRRGDAEVGEHRRRLVGEGREAFHRGAELAQERREQDQVAFERSRGAARSPGRRCCSARSSRRTACAPPRAARAPCRSPRPVWPARGSRSARIASTLSSSCSAGLARRMTAFRSLPRPARPTPSSLRMIVRRWRSGRRRDVVEQVRVDRAVGVLHGQQLLAGAFLAGGDRLQRRRQRRAFHARLRWAGSRRTSRRAAPGDGSCRWRSSRKSWKPGFSMLQHDRGLLLRRGGHRRDRPDLDPVDLDVLAGDDVGGVVEDRAHRVAATAAAGRDGEQHDHARHGERTPRRRYRPRPSSPRPTSASTRSFLYLNVSNMRTAPSVRWGRPPTSIGSSLRPRVDNTPASGPRYCAVLLPGAGRLVVRRDFFARFVGGQRRDRRTSVPTSAGSRLSGTSWARCRSRRSFSALLVGGAGVTMIFSTDASAAPGTVSTSGTVVLVDGVLPYATWLGERNSSAAGVRSLA